MPAAIAVYDSSGKIKAGVLAVNQVSTPHHSLPSQLSPPLQGMRHGPSEAEVCDPLRLPMWNLVCSCLQGALLLFLGRGSRKRVLAPLPRAPVVFQFFQVEPQVLRRDADGTIVETGDSFTDPSCVYDMESKRFFLSIAWFVSDPLFPSFVSDPLPLAPRASLCLHPR